MPRPGSHVIHPRLADMAARLDQAAMPGTCRIERAGPEPVRWNEDAQAFVETVPTVIYSGPFRAAAVSPTAGRPIELGDDGRNVTRYLVSIDTAVWVRPDDQVVVVDSTDTGIEGRTLLVAEVLGSTQGPARKFTAVDHLG